MPIFGEIAILVQRLLLVCSVLFVFSGLHTEAIAQPANNNCATAQPVIIPGSGTICINSSSLTATSSNTTNACNLTAVNEVWFSYITAGPANTITVTPNGGSPIQQAVVTITDALCGAGTYSTCDAAANAGASASASWAYGSGTQVYISVAGIMGDGTFELCITSETPPPTPGSNCGGATPTCSSSPFTVNSTAGNPSSGISPACFNPLTVQNDLWFVFSVGQTGTLEFTANLNGAAEFDWAVFNITNGCPGTLMSCNYFYSGGNSGSIGMGLPAGGEFNAPLTVTTGNTYAIMIDNYSNNGVGFDFDWGGTFQMAPTADFTVNTPSACNTLTTTFTNNTVGATSYTWDFGNGNTSTAQNPPAETYSTPGTYFVTLDATSAAGCTSSFSGSVEVFPDPTINIAPTDESCAGACDGQLVASASGTGPFSYSWTSGGATSTEASLCANSYDVTVVDQSNGCTATATGTVASGGATLDATITPAGPFCMGDAPVNLTAVDGGGTWSGTGITNTANGTFDPAVAGAGTWTITYTIAGACGDIQTTDITVSNQLDATITAAGPFCTSDAAINLSAASAGGTWSGTGITDGVLGTFDPSVAGVGSWTVTYTIAGACGSTDTETITVDPNFDATIAQVGPFCTSDAALNLTAVDAGGTWSGNGITDPALGTFDPATVGTGTWTINYTIAGTCGDAHSIDIVVAEVTFTQSLANVTCNGADDGEISIQNETGTAPHLFSIDGATTSQASGLFQGLADGNYTLVVEDDNGCVSQPISVVITEPTSISLNVSMDQESSCGVADGTVTVTASGGTVAVDYQYSWNSSPVQTTATATGLGPAVYTVTVTDDNGCTETADIEVTATPGFTASISSFTDASCYQLCDGQATGEASNTAILPVSFSWNDSQNQSTATASSLCSGTYTVTITDDVGCIATATTTIAEPTQVTTELAANDSSICIGESSDLLATVTGGTAPYADSNWVADPVDPTLTNGLQNPTVSPVVTTTYTLIVTDANGCTSAAQSIVIEVLPALTLSVTRPLSGPDTSMCLGEIATIDLEATGGDGNYSYFLLPDLSTPINPPIEVDPAATTLYVFSVSDGCTTPAAQISSTVTIHPIPEVDFEGDSLSGCDPHNTTFTDLTDPTPATWEWNFGDPDSDVNSSIVQNPAFGFSGPGTYDITLSIVTAEGCTAELTKADYVEVFVRPTADFEASPEITSIINPRISFTDLSNGEIDTWDWDFGDLNSSIEQNPVYSYSDTGTFSVWLHVVSVDGCASSTRGQISLTPILTFYMPNAFTPDKDHINDTFRGYGEGYDWSTFEMFVYDRWGTVIFYSSDIENGWNGKYKDEKVGPGVYAWKVLISDFNGRTYPFSGHVSLMR